MITINMLDAKTNLSRLRGDAGTLAKAKSALPFGKALLRAV